jgi:putative FmdB family regulatory protein
MPLYEFRCETCGARFEKLFRSSAETVGTPECPACHGQNVRRLISAPAVLTSDGAGKSAAADEEPKRPKMELFGRKELHEALKAREKASYDE